VKFSKTCRTTQQEPCKECDRAIAVWLFLQASCSTIAWLDDWTRLLLQHKQRLEAQLSKFTPVIQGQVFLRRDRPPCMVSRRWLQIIVQSSQAAAELQDLLRSLTSCMMAVTKLGNMQQVSCMQ
jgi:hypothetical protein